MFSLNAIYFISNNICWTYLNISLFDNLQVYDIDFILAIKKYLNLFLANSNEIIKTQGMLEIVHNNFSFYT